MATNDANPRYDQSRAGTRLIAPPMFAVVLEMPVMMTTLKDPEVIVDPKRFLRLLHGEHDLRFHGALLPGHSYSTIATVARVTDKGTNEVIDLKLETIDERTGDLVVETAASMFIRGEGKDPSKDANKDQGKASQAAPAAGAVKLASSDLHQTPLFEAHELVAADQSLRYAAASGDHNPIHTDREIATKAGLPDIILHGLCSMAFCQKAIVDTVCGGDPARLKRLKVRFAKPVLMGQTLAIRAFDIESAPWGRSLGFEARVGDAVVLKDGLAEISA